MNRLIMCRDGRVEKMMREAGVDFFIQDDFDVSRIYTQLTAGKVSFDSTGWTGNTVEELKQAWFSKQSDGIFLINEGEEKPFMLEKDSEYKALYYANQNL